MAEHPGASTVKLALAELRELRARVNELERERSEPIAIVGLAGRFPGAPDADALWDLIRDGRDGITDVPADRWDMAAFFDEDPDAPAKMYTRRGGFLPEVDRFDAHFFGVSPREAVSMDPQQRLLLETVWRALEHAAIAPARLAGTETGVFVGLSNIDYYRMAFERRDEIDAYYGSGTSGSVAAGRISYVLGLRGPSLVVDTACSSSLVATHLACQSLRNRECRVALAGGVNLILTPDINIACSKARMMSPDGLCKTFDARADGYVRSEGCAVVVLKRLEDAERDGDRILALLRGSAVNQDGRSGGLTVPNGPAQEAVIRRALESAGVAPHEVDYVEAHGTGTALGDPIEVRALGRVFADRANGDPLAIGSIKANVGHLEAAAGLAGLVKVVLALQHGTMPGHPHLGAPNPHLDWESLPLTVPTGPKAWPAGERRRIAGVSSFGFSGTNAHAIVEGPPAPVAASAALERTHHILTLSARTRASLDELTDDFAGFLRAAPDATSLGDVCLSANAGRSHFAHRLAVVGATPRDMADALESGADSFRAARGLVDVTAPDAVFLFTGQGAQYSGMARTLYETHPAFRATLIECERLLSGLLEPSLSTVLFDEASSPALLADTKYAQPALFAMEYALAQLWRSWGIEPAAVLGHSVGEFAAACVAGVFSLEDALRLIAERGRLMQSLPDAGAMAAVFADEQTVRRVLAGREDVLSVAALNGPDQTVISGERAAAREVARTFADRGIQVRDLGASRAFHSPLLDPILDAFGQAAASVTLRPPQVPLISNLTGDVAGDDVARSDYWTRHARQPVQFQRGVETLRARGHRVFIEIGPSPTLIGMARRFADAADVRWLPSLRKNRNDWDELLSSLAAVYVEGADVDWAAFDREYSRRKVSVPGYRFQRERYWLEAPRSAFGNSAGVEAPTETVSRTSGTLYEIAWQLRERSGPLETPKKGDTWLLLSDTGGVARALEQRFRAAGESVVLARPDDASPTDGTICLDPAQPEQIVALLQQIRERGEELRGIVHLWSLDLDETCDSSAALSAAQERTCRSLLSLVQGLDGGRFASPPRLWIVTRGAQAVDTDVSPGQAPVWGMASVVSVEHPELACTCVDLSRAADPAEVDALWAEIEAGDSEDRVVVRGERRYVPRLTESTWTAPTSVDGSQLSADATYLVTGGLGGLGLSVARMLVDRGARNIVLVARRPPDEAAEATIRDLTDGGCRVVVARADVSREHDVVALFDEIAATLPPLRGVIHAAGVLDDGVLMRQSWDRFEKVLAPKVAGAWHLHQATLRLPLDFFVLFSSGAAFFGSPGQANYAAANSFLDALAHHRRAKALPATSINWGPWASAGMTAASDYRERWENWGLELLEPATALELLAGMLKDAPPQIAVMPLDEQKVAERFRDTRRLSVFADVAAPEPSRVRAAEGDLARALAAAPVNDRRTIVQACVSRHVRETLRLASDFDLNPRQGLRDLGLDSLMALELRGRLQSAVGRSLSSTIAFDHPTVDALTDHIAFTVLALERAARAEVAAGEPIHAATAEPIAVIGVGCRMPGGVDSAEAFWTLLRDGVDAIGQVPRERWNPDALGDAPALRWGGFLDGVDRFDPHFFGIAPREAVFMDPQQRLLLEVGWQALEHAAQSPDRLAQTKAGVFVGISTCDYGQLLLNSGHRDELDAYMSTGNAPSVAAGRLAYVLGLQGPAMSVDTACSSSLVAVHLACRSLRSGDCRIALAGGVNLLLLPESNLILSKAGMLSPDGRCKTFDAAADGYVRGDGCGVVVLKRLRDAEADGDRILAVIRGTAVNHDGRSSGLTVPNGPAQEAVIRAALADGQVAPAQVSYIEAHGTGTSLGDPIELQALRAVLGEGRGAEAPLVLGSVKTNIGHLESAAGIAGLIKVVLALQHGEIPPHLHFRTLNPHIALDGFPAVIPTARLAWPAGPARRIAGVSSFGFSGTNAHVVLEAAPQVQEDAPSEVERPLHLLPLSAKTDEALAVVAARYAEQFTQQPEISLADAAFTAGTGRSQFPRRLAVSAATIAEARDALLAFAASSPHAGLQRTAGAAGAAPEIAFLFTGQGSQYAGMARQLYETQPVFRDALRRCDELLRPVLDVPLLSVLYPSDGGKAALLDQTRYTQPALFAIEYALAELWQSWGVRPAAVLGHSVGEYVAACIAGVFSLEAGLNLIATRARLMQALPEGSMAAISAPVERAVDVIRAWDSLSIAAINGPDDTVISGPAPAVGEALRAFQAEGVRHQLLNVSHAFHSVLLAPMLDEFERAVSEVSLSLPRIPLAANLTGRAADHEIATAQYWRRHAREPVLFAAGVRTLVELGCTHFLEIGPKPTLVAIARRSAQQSDAMWLPSLRPGRDDWAQMAESLGFLYTAGAPVDWVSFDRPYTRRRITLPTYPFERERFWIDTKRALAETVSTAVTDWLYEIAWRATPRPASVDPMPVEDGQRRATWWLLGESNGLAARLARMLEEQGARCVRLAHPADLDRLGEALRGSGSIGGVVHLWGLESTPSEQTTLSSLETARTRGVQSLARVVQTLLTSSAPPPRLFVVTRGAQTVDVAPGIGSIAQAPVWGLGRVIALEHPEIWGGLVDLDPAATEDEAAVLVSEMLGPDGEDQIVYRGRQRYAARLVRSHAVAHRTIECRADATYLITGGVGGIGLELAGWMADRGAKRVVLTGRAGLPARDTWAAVPHESAAGVRIAAVRALEARGVHVRIVQADAGDRDAMAALFDELRASAAPLRGIVHAAGLLRPQELKTADADNLAEVFRPKVAGAWNLHELSRDCELDFFALLSSGAAIWGSKGLGHYAAANHFLDALSHYRRAIGLPGVSINWGPWGEAGLSSIESRRWLAQIGLKAFTTREGLHTFARVLGAGVAQVAAAKVDWRTFKGVYAAKGARRLLDELDGGDVSDRSASAGGGELAAELARTIPGERRDRLVAYLQGEVAAVLGIHSRRPDPRQGFSELGMDSLMAVDLRNRLQHALGRQLPPTLAFDYPTIEALTAFAITTVLGLAGPALEGQADAAESDVAEIAPLSDQEVKELIAGELEALSLGGFMGENS